MGLLRAFLASEFPTALQNEIHTATGPLRELLGNDVVRWVPPQNIHLTLKFLGDVTPPGLNLIQQMLLAEAGQFPAFDVHVKGLGCYPSPRRPRVLWVGLIAPTDLSSLQRAIETAAARLGYEAEQRAFSPHVTIGRVRQNATSTDIHNIRTALEGTNIGALGSTRVDAIHLFKSELRPEGSVYTSLFSAPLRKT